MQGKARRGLRWMLAAGIVAVGATAARAVNILVTTDIAVSETWTANNVYILDKPIYVKSGATLTIEPGTVVRGDNAVLPATDPGTLIVTRGSKIRALGTATHPPASPAFTGCGLTRKGWELAKRLLREYLRYRA